MGQSQGLKDPGELSVFGFVFVLVLILVLVFGFLSALALI